MKARIVCATVLLLLPMVPGCGPGSQERSSTVTITFWHSFVASTIPSLNDLLREFERTNPGIRIKAQYIPTGDGLIQKLVSSVQGGTAPDISWIHPDFLDKLVEAEAIYPLDAFVKGSDSLSDQEIADIYPALREDGRYKGVTYAFPMEATSLSLLYNKDLFRKAGLDPDQPPQTWDQLRSYVRKLTGPVDAEGRRDRYGFFVPVFPASGELNIWMLLQWTPFLWQAGGEVFSEDGNHVTVNSQAGVQALGLWKELYEMQDFSKCGIAHDVGFASGKLAMVLDGPWNLPKYRLLTGVEWGVAPLPRGPRRNATYLSGEQLVIFRQSQRPSEAWKFIRWILRPDIQVRFSMASGYLPVRRSVQKDSTYRAFLMRDTALRTYVDQMEFGLSPPQANRHRVEINRVLAEAIEKATLGRLPAAMCLDEAAHKCDILLQADQ